MKIQDSIVVSTVFWKNKSYSVKKRKNQDKWQNMSNKLVRIIVEAFHRKKAREDVISFNFSTNEKMWGNLYEWEKWDKYCSI